MNEGLKHEYSKTGHILIVANNREAIRLIRATDGDHFLHLETFYSTWKTHINATRASFGWHPWTLA